MSETLCAFLAASTPDALPNEVLEHASSSVLNVIATAIAGCRDPAVERALAVMAPFGGPAGANLIGRTERVDPTLAAFLNAAASNVHDFDDTHTATIAHPAGPVTMAALAAAQMRPVSGLDFLHAVTLGIEVTCRVANAVSPEHYSRGAHITSTCGVFGAAAAIGTLLRLDAGQMRDALGIASASSCGLVETLGFMAKSVGVGNAARGGLLAALLAEAGVDGPPRPLEGARGFFAVATSAPRPQALVDGLGTHWEMTRNYAKPYPCGIVLNAVVDAAFVLRERLGADAAPPQRITVTGGLLLAQRADRPHVTTGREAQVSAQHAVATVLIRGDAGVAGFSDEAVADPAVRALADRVSVATDPAYPLESVELRAELADGSTETILVEHARGTAGRPLSHGEIEDKLRAIAADGPVDAQRLIRAVNDLADQADAGVIATLAAA